MTNNGLFQALEFCENRHIDTLTLSCLLPYNVPLDTTLEGPDRQNGLSRQNLFQLLGKEGLEKLPHWTGTQPFSRSFVGRVTTRWRYICGNAIGNEGFNCMGELGGRHCAWELYCIGRWVVLLSGKGNGHGNLCAALSVPVIILQMRHAWKFLLHCRAFWSVGGAGFQSCMILCRWLSWLLM